MHMDMTKKLAQARKAAFASKLGPLLEKMEPQWVMMTPELAAELLKNTEIAQAMREAEGEAAPINRTPSQLNINKIARDLEDGNYYVNGHSIVLGELDEVRDGQHRLLACVKSEVSFPTILLRGLPDANMVGIDGGKTRQAHDYFQLKGVASAKNTVSALRALKSIALGRAKEGLTSSEARDLYAIHPKISDSLVGNSMSGVPGSIAAAVHYIATVYLESPDDANAFIQVLSTGVPYYEDDAAHACREFFVKAAMRKSGLYPEVRQSAVIHAWNMFAARKPVKVFRVPDHVAIVGFEEEDLWRGPKKAPAVKLRAV